jgi:hypothetical protein
MPPIYFRAKSHFALTMPQAWCKNSVVQVEILLSPGPGVLRRGFLSCSGLDQWRVSFNPLAERGAKQVLESLQFGDGQAGKPFAQPRVH